MPKHLEKDELLARIDKGAGNYADFNERIRCFVTRKKTTPEDIAAVTDRLILDLQQKTQQRATDYPDYEDSGNSSVGFKMLAASVNNLEAIIVNDEVVRKMPRPYLGSVIGRMAETMAAEPYLKNVIYDSASFSIIKLSELDATDTDTIAPLICTLAEKTQTFPLHYIQTAMLVNYDDKNMQSLLGAEGKTRIVTAFANNANFLKLINHTDAHVGAFKELAKINPQEITDKKPLVPVARAFDKAIQEALGYGELKEPYSNKRTQLIQGRAAVLKLGGFEQ